MANKLNNIHPGKIFLEEFLLPLVISQNMLARDISVSAGRINDIVHGKRAITANTVVPRLVRGIQRSSIYKRFLDTADKPQYDGKQSFWPSLII